MVEWQQVAEHFEVDGALRDIVVPDIWWEEWKLFCVMIREGSWDAVLETNGRMLAWPDDLSRLFPQFEGPFPVLLTLTVGPFRLHCHFFTPVEIELDIDPADVTERSFPQLLSFLRDVGRAVGRDVVVTYENALDTAFLEYSVSRDACRTVDALED